MPRTRRLLITTAVLSTTSLGATLNAADFEKPYRMEAGGDYVKVEAPGYAAPCWHDLNGDGHGDLIVGQFNGGKMKVYMGSESGLTTGEWLKADGKIAQVPGVW